MKSKANCLTFNTQNLLKQLLKLGPDMRKTTRDMGKLLTICLKQLP